MGIAIRLDHRFQVVICLFVMIELSAQIKVYARASRGYEGNPYLLGGCQDINEYADPSKKDCEFFCKNTTGSYRCSCPTGYLLSGNSCMKIQENNKMKTILIGMTICILH